MAISDRQLMLAGMKPSLEPGDYVFCTSNAKDDAVWLELRPLGIFREAEGTTLILENTVARSHGLVASAPMRKITLGVYSALEGVGLTAAISTALAEAGIACNVVAGFHHDHVFVPSEMGDRALAVLQKGTERSYDVDYGRQALTTPEPEDRYTIRAFWAKTGSPQRSTSLFLRNSGRKTASHFCWNC